MLHQGTTIYKTLSTGVALELVFTPRYFENAALFKDMKCLYFHQFRRSSMAVF